MLSAGSKVHLHMSCYVFEFMDFCFVGVTFFGHLFNGRAVKKDREMGKRHTAKGPGSEAGHIPDRSPACCRSSSCI